MKTTIFICLLIVLFGCQQESTQMEGKVAFPLEDDLEIEPPATSSPDNSKLLAGNFQKPPQTPKTNQSPQKPQKKRKVIKTATLDINVTDYKNSRAALDDILQGKEAYITRENEQNSTYFVKNTLVIRVEPTALESMVKAIETMAIKVNSKKVTAKDVTKEFLDIEARLKSKRAVIKRYQELLTKAKTIEEILKVENNLRLVIEEVESAEGQLKYLKNQVGMSTINLTITENFDRPKTYAPSFFAKLGKAFKNGWDGLLDFVLGVVTVWPFLLMLIIGIFLWRYFRKGR